MKKTFSSIASVFVVVFTLTLLSACDAANNLFATSTPPFTSTPSATFTPAATFTPLPTNTLTPTATPFQVVSNETPLPAFDETISLDNVERITELATWQTPMGNKKYLGPRLAFSPDSQLLAIGLENGTMQVSEVKSGKLLELLEGPLGDEGFPGETWRKSMFMGVAFSPDGQVLAGGPILSILPAKTFKVYLWQTSDFTEIDSRIKDKHWIWSLDFSPDGNRLAVGSYDNFARIYSYPSGKLLAEMFTNSGSVISLDFSPDGKKIAVGSGQPDIRVYPSSGGERIVRLYSKEKPNFCGCAVAFSPDGKILATPWEDNSIALWNTSDWSIIKTLNVGVPTSMFSVMSLSFTPDGSMLAAGSFDGRMTIWSMQDYSLLTISSENYFPGEPVTSVAFSPDGKLLAWINDRVQNGIVHIWGIR